MPPYSRSFAGTCWLRMTQAKTLGLSRCDLIAANHGCGAGSKIAGVGKIAPCTTRNRTPKWAVYRERIEEIIAAQPDITLQELKGRTSCKRTCAAKRCRPRCESSSFHNAWYKNLKLVNYMREEEPSVAGLQAIVETQSKQVAQPHCDSNLQGSGETV